MRRRFSLLAIALGLAVGLVFLPPIRHWVHWRYALAESSAESMRDFLYRWPESVHAHAARTTHEERRWAAACSDGSIAALSKYLAEVPNGAHAAQAESQIEMLEWKAIRPEAEPRDYESFLRKYPSGAHASHARASLIEALAREVEAHWSFATGRDTILSYLWFADEHPGDVRSTEARGRVVQLASDTSISEAVLAAPSTEGLKSFLRDYPGHKSEPIVRDLLHEMTGASVDELLARERVSVSISLASAPAALLRLRSLARHSIRVVLKRGARLGCDVEPIAVVRDERVWDLQPGAEIEFSVGVYLACINQPVVVSTRSGAASQRVRGLADNYAHRMIEGAIPVARASGVFMPKDTDALGRVFKVTQDLDAADYDVGQAAIWIGVCNWNLTKMSAFYWRPDGLRSEERTPVVDALTAVRAMRLLDAHGIDLGALEIAHDSVLWNQLGEDDQSWIRGLRH